MNRTAFEYLYMHANSIAELGLVQLSARFAMRGADDELAHLSADEREALALARLGKMDMSMIEGLTWETPQHDAAARRVLGELQASAQSASEPGKAEAEPAVVRADGADGAHGDAVPVEPDLALYLARAYAAADQIKLRVDAGMGLLDMARLGALLAALPADLAPLDGALDADGLARWLACYECGHPALDELVTLCRALAFDGDAHCAMPGSPMLAQGGRQ